MSGKENIGYIYMITSPTNKIYIGSTTQNPENRWEDYFNISCKSQTKLYNSLKKYGANSHIFETIMEITFDQLYKYETLIGWGFNVLDEGLNCRLPKLGDVYSCMSDETKSKIGSKNKGKIRSKELRDKLSKANKGNKHSIKTKEKISLNSGARNKSDEWIKNSSEGHKISIIQYDLNMNFIKEWKSGLDAEKALLINRFNINSCCNNKRKSAGGFKWKYKK